MISIPEVQSTSEAGSALSLQEEGLTALSLQAILGEMLVCLPAYLGASMREIMTASSRDVKNYDSKLLLGCLSNIAHHRDPHHHDCN